MIEHAQVLACDLMLRPVKETDWPSLVGLLRAAVSEQDAFTYDENLSDAQLQGLWNGSDIVIVAESTDGTVAGSAKIGRNQGGPGAHVATASFLVAPAWRRRGVGRRLCRHAISWAAQAGFRAMQFNAVVASNDAAVRLWQSEGFATVGVVPGAFRHPRLGLVDLLVMHRENLRGK